MVSTKQMTYRNSGRIHQSSSFQGIKPSVFPIIRDIVNNHPLSKGIFLGSFLLIRYN